MMRKPTWLDLGIVLLGLFLVCGAAQQGGQNQTPYNTYTETPSAAAEDIPVGDVTQDSRDTGTWEGMGSETGTGGAGTVEQETVEQGPVEQGPVEQGPVEQGTGTQQTAVDEAQQRLEVARLRTEVARLEQQLARMRAQLSQAEAGVGGSGQGGSGSAGTEDANTEAAELSTGVGDVPDEGAGREGAGRGDVGRTQVTPPGTSSQGYAEAVVIFTGRVRSVSQQQLVLEDSGILNTLPLASNVRVLHGRQQVSLKSLREGTRVRVSADMYTRGNPVTEIQILSSSPS